MQWRPLYLISGDMMASKKDVVSNSSAKSLEVKVSDLDFDPDNPRFPKEIAAGPRAQLIERFVRDERLLELVESIGNQGFFGGEPLLVVKDGGRFVVLEGNRRLAALKLLAGEIKPPSGRISIEEAINAAVFKPEKVACLLFTDRSEILRYLGFRHITGIKAWSALQKARYIKRLRNEHYAALSYEDSLKALARETGSKGSYIGQVLAALALYEKAEAENFFGLQMSADDVDFSILSTALSYANVVEYLGLSSRIDADQGKLKKKNLERIFFWNFVKDDSRRSIVKDSRNLKKLAAIVASKDAVKELNESGRIDQAYSMSKGPAVALSEAMAHAASRLQMIYELIPKVTELDVGHLEASKRILKISRSVKNMVESEIEDDLIDSQED